MSIRIKTSVPLPEGMNWSNGILKRGDLEEGSLNRKYIGKIQFMIELERGSQVDVFLKHDSDAAFRRMITIFAEKNGRIRFRLSRCAASIIGGG